MWSNHILPEANSSTCVLGPISSPLFEKSYCSNAPIFCSDHFPPKITSAYKHAVISPTFQKHSWPSFFHRLLPHFSAPHVANSLSSHRTSVSLSLLLFSLMTVTIRLSLPLLHQSCSHTCQQWLPRRQIQWLVLNSHHTRHSWSLSHPWNPIFIWLLESQELPQPLVLPLFNWAASQCLLLLIPHWLLNVGVPQRLVFTSFLWLCSIFVDTMLINDFQMQTSIPKSILINPTAYSMLSPLGGLDSSNLTSKTEHLIFFPKTLPTTAFPIWVDGNTILSVAWTKSLTHPWFFSFCFFSSPTHPIQSIRQCSGLYLQK